jgi:hypothetical protein
MVSIIRDQCAEPVQTKDVIPSKRMLTGRITDLVITTLTEFGTRASFRIERAGQCPVFCCVDGNVARELIADYCDGDLVALTGFDEPRPSTAAVNTPWPGRFRVRAVRAAEDVRLAA